MYFTRQNLHSSAGLAMRVEHFSHWALIRWGRHCFEKRRREKLLNVNGNPSLLHKESLSVFADYFVQNDRPCFTLPREPCLLWFLKIWKFGKKKKELISQLEVSHFCSQTNSAQYEKPRNSSCMA